MKPLPTLHPPLAKGEKFLGNQIGQTLPSHLQGIRGLRLASPAYDLAGEMLPGHFALVADQAGVEDYSRVMESHLSAIRRGTK